MMDSSNSPGALGRIRQQPSWLALLRSCLQLSGTRSPVVRLADETQGSEIDNVEEQEMGHITQD